ncbi:hypothetical protein [Herbidospora daliensis]|uniref:hypothetical protein n=1 Tax=Herbidospora daliensis TaxID=295585 RepID=UPI0007850023|nr:hypothetical protein [Herbidospora daliensis]
MTRRSQVLDHPGLFDLAQPEATPPATINPELKVRRSRHVLDLPRKPAPGPCAPTCLTCGREEGYGLCNPCAVICERPKTRVLVEVCIIRDHVTAYLTDGIPIAGRLMHQLARVVCPKCGDLHWHTPGATRVVNGRCGASYVIHHTERTST